MFHHFSSQTSTLPVSFLAGSHFVGAGAIKEGFVCHGDLGSCDRPAVCLLFWFLHRFPAAGLTGAASQ